MTAWQRRYGRHGLPWQGPGDPYRVWVSEVMLQQTQVATVLPAYQRFIARFPTVQALAAAPLDEVLGLWSGLGYYSRARNLHRAARQVASLGELPADIDSLMRLPGIGRSTAAAIVSLAFDRPAAILDGNVRRVLARHAGIAGWPAEADVLRRLWAEAESRLPAPSAPSGTAATYTQSLMDLGATVCHRRRPDCERCPVAADCRARLDERVDQIPAPRPARERLRRRIDLLLDCSAEGVALVRRPERGVWGGLWCLPEGHGGVAWHTMRHELTHLRLEIAIARAGAGAVMPTDAQRFAWQEVWPLGLPQPVRQALRMAHGEVSAQPSIKATT